jgi:hypothetical protein
MVLRVLSLVRSAALCADEVHLMSARAELPDLTETLSAIAAFVRSSQGLWREEAAELMTGKASRGAVAGSPFRLAS